MGAVRKILQNWDWKFYVSVGVGVVSLGLMLKYIRKTDELIDDHEIPKQRNENKENDDSQQSQDVTDENVSKYPIMSFLKMYGQSEQKEKPIYELNHPPVETSP